MCGIVGYCSLRSENPEIINKMTNMLVHRGPDFKDTFISNNQKLYLGHTRLSILDISSNAD